MTTESSEYSIKQYLAIEIQAVAAGSRSLIASRALYIVGQYYRIMAIEVYANLVTTITTQVWHPDHSLARVSVVTYGKFEKGGKYSNSGPHIKLTLSSSHKLPLSLSSQLSPTQSVQPTQWPSRSGCQSLVALFC